MLRLCLLPGKLKAFLRGSNNLVKLIPGSSHPFAPNKALVQKYQCSTLDRLDLELLEFNVL